MKKALSILGILITITLLSFKPGHPTKKLTLKTGAYGVCSCAESSTKVELIINDDNTFHYFDSSNPSKLIDVKGNWSLTDNTISLKDYKSGFPIQNKWTIDDNEKCLKSRKGLSWMRLCHLQACR